MIDWRVSRFVVLILLLLTLVVGVGLAGRLEPAAEGRTSADESFFVRFLDWWRREEPLPTPQVMARPARLPRFPVVVPPVNPEPPFVPRPVVVAPEGVVGIVPGLVPGVVYCPPGLVGSPSPWCA